MMDASLIPALEGVRCCPKAFIAFQGTEKTTCEDVCVVSDSIEANVESAAVHVEEGVQQVAKAHQHQVKARKKMFCLFIIAAVVLAIVITIIVLSVKR